VSRLALGHPALRRRTQYNLIPNAIEAYTDGSKNDYGVGSRYILLDNQSVVLEGTSRLSEHCSVFQAELWAILKALRFAATTHRKNINIYTDSRSAWYSLRTLIVGIR